MSALVKSRIFICLFLISAISAAVLFDFFDLKYAVAQRRESASAGPQESGILLSKIIQGINEPPLRIFNREELKVVVKVFTGDSYVLKGSAKIPSSKGRKKQQTQIKLRFPSGQTLGQSSYVVYEIRSGKKKPDNRKPIDLFIFKLAVENAESLGFPSSATVVLKRYIELLETLINLSQNKQPEEISKITQEQIAQTEQNRALTPEERQVIKVILTIVQNAIAGGEHRLMVWGQGGEMPGSYQLSRLMISLLPADPARLVKEKLTNLENLPFPEQFKILGEIINLIWNSREVSQSIIKAFLAELLMVEGQAESGNDTTAQCRLRDRKTNDRAVTTTITTTINECNRLAGIVISGVCLADSAQQVQKPQESSPAYFNLQNKSTGLVPVVLAQQQVSVNDFYSWPTRPAQNPCEEQIQEFCRDRRHPPYNERKYVCGNFAVDFMEQVKIAINNGSFSATDIGYSWSLPARHAFNKVNCGGEEAYFDPQSCQFVANAPLGSFPMTTYDLGDAKDKVRVNTAGLQRGYWASVLEIFF